MSKITPNLWFDQEAKEAAVLYTSVIPGSQVTDITTIHDTPSGDSDIVSFTLAGQPFMALNAGPLFKFNQSVSFIVNFDPAKDKNAKENLDAAWAKLVAGGKVLMPLDKYPFSSRYGWIQDKFGLSWQLILTNPAGEPRPVITPLLMFVGNVVGKAAEAIDFYLSVFKESQMGVKRQYGPGQEPDKEGTTMYADFKLLDTWFGAMDSAHKHDFAFNEAISFIVNCTDQAEVDYYWDKLSAVPEAEQCGWLKDKFGVSWQIVPTVMNDLLADPDEAKRDRVTQALLKMKKFDIAALQAAAKGP